MKGLVGLNLLKRMIREPSQFQEEMSCDRPRNRSLLASSSVV